MSWIEWVRVVSVAVLFATVGGISVVAIWMGICVGFYAVSRSRVERVAVKQFRKDYPSISFGSTRKCQMNDSNIVIFFGCGAGKPGDVIFYEVAPDDTAAEIGYDERYLRSSRK